MIHDEAARSYKVALLRVKHVVTSCNIKEIYILLHQYFESIIICIILKWAVWVLHEYFCFLKYIFLYFLLEEKFEYMTFYNIYTVMQ